MLCMVSKQKFRRFKVKMRNWVFCIQLGYNTSPNESLGPMADTSTEQSEMPFAIVQGQAITELPHDLYIPPDALEVILEAFEGPLDLLLYLIRKQNIDILDIPIAKITEQYVEYINLMQVMRFELAAEYLSMAAILAQIKSRMLLPRVKPVDEEDETDPRAELIRRLQEYERFRQAAQDIDDLPRLERDIFTAQAHVQDRSVVTVPPEVDLQDLLLALSDVVKRSELFEHHQIEREPLSVRERMTRVLQKLRESPHQDFHRLFDPEEGRMGVIVTFLAVLELLKAGLLELVQNKPLGPIHLRSLVEQE